MADILITNNTDFLDRESWPFEIEYLDTLDYMQVLVAVRDRVHAGYVLLTHPLSGSVKPYETPYKSVLIRKGGDAVDSESLALIEDAIVMAEKFKRERHFNERLLSDFRLIDMDLITRGM